MPGKTKPTLTNEDDDIGMPKNEDELADVDIIQHPLDLYDDIDYTLIQEMPNSSLQLATTELKMTSKIKLVSKMKPMMIVDEMKYPSEKRSSYLELGAMELKIKMMTWDSVAVPENVITWQWTSNCTQM